MLSVLALLGCASVPEAAVLALPQNHAEVAVTNLTPHAWRLTLQAPEPAKPILVEVQPRETIAAVIPAGDYVIKQALLSSVDQTAASREVTARFEANERYRWDLATLLSVDAVAAP